MADKSQILTINEPAYKTRGLSDTAQHKVVNFLNTDGKNQYLQQVTP